MVTRESSGNAKTKCMFYNKNNHEIQDSKPTEERLSFIKFQVNFRNESYLDLYQLLTKEQYSLDLKNKLHIVEILLVLLVR